MEKYGLETRHTILIADNSAMSRAIAAEMLGDTYRILEAESGAQTLKVIQEHRGEIDLLLLDNVMPEMDGLAVLKAMRRSAWSQDIPVIMISSEKASSYFEQAYELGVADYISKPFDALVVRRRVANTLMLYAKQKQLTRMAADQIYEKEKTSNLMISILSHIVEFRNRESGLHVFHIRALTELLLRDIAQRSDRYSLTQADIALIGTASVLHDIGKISVSEEILNKPGKLTLEEIRIMEAHTVVGADILKALPAFQNEAMVKVAYEICRWHHERYDGQGYPDGLRGEQIPISAQVVGLADAYDALTSRRCYKEAFSHEKAIQMIMDGECGAFSPLLRDCLAAAADSIPQALQEGESSRTDRKIYSVIEELLHNQGMENFGHTVQMVEIELEKAQFFASKATEIQFDYNALTDVVTVSEHDAKLLGLDKTVFKPHDQNQSFLGRDNIEELAESLRRSAPGSPDVQKEFLALVSGEYRWHRITVRSIWSHGDAPRYLGVIGKITDIHDWYIRQAGNGNAKTGDRGEIFAAFMHQLQKVFDVVRLVDVTNAVQLTIDEKGAVCAQPQHCYAVWNKPGRCENCISAKAFARKTQLTKFEFTDQNIYQVTAKYVEVEGVPCVLELVSKIEDEILMSVYGKNMFINQISNYNKELYLDPMTGAYNRRYFEDQMKKLGKLAAVAMLDVDNFKQINDSFGHYAGDLALCSIVQTVRDCLESADILLRYGGDEFLLLFPRIERDAFGNKLMEITKRVAGTVIGEYPKIRLSVSIGGVFSVYPVGEAVRQADMLMYEAKKTKNTALVN